MTEEYQGHFFVLVGAFSGGKSTLIRAINQAQILGNKVTITDGFYIPFIRIMIPDKKSAFYFVETEVLHHEYILKPLHNNIFIIVVDSAKDIDEYGQDRNVIGVMRYHKMHYIIAASHQDEPDAFSLGDLRYILSVPDDIEIVTVNPLFDLASVRKLFLKLMKLLGQEDIVQQIENDFQSSINVRSKAILIMTIWGFDLTTLCEDAGFLYITVGGNQKIVLYLYRFPVDEELSIYFASTKMQEVASQSDHEWINEIERFIAKRIPIVAPMSYLLPVFTEKPETFPHIQTVKHQLHESKILYHIVAIHKSNPEVLDSVRALFQIPTHIPVLPCQTDNKEDVKAIVLDLLSHLPKTDYIERATRRVQES